MAKSITIEVSLDSKGAVSGIKSIDGALDVFTNETKKADKATKSLWKQFAQGAIVSKAVTKGIQLITDGLKAGSKSLIEFDKEFANVLTLIDDDKAFPNLRKDILNLAGPLGNVHELTQGLYQAISAGQKPGEAVKFVGEAAIFAKAGLAEMGDSVKLLTGFLNSYELESAEVTRVSDIMFQVIKDGVTTGQELASTLGSLTPTAAAMGVSIEEVGAAMATMTKFNLSTDNAVTALNQTLLAILKVTPQARKQAEELGLEFSRLGIKHAGGLQNFLLKVKDAVGDNKEAMNELFPNIRALKGALILAGNGAETFRKEMIKMNDSVTLAGNSQRAFEKQQKTFGATFDAIKNKLEAIFIKTLLPALADMAKWLKSNEESIINFLTGAIESMATFTKLMIGTVKTLFEFKDILLAIGTAWAVNFAITKITAIGSAIVTAFTSAKVSAMAFHTVALGVAGIITGVLLKAIDMLNSSYNETKKKLIESTEEFKKNIEIQKQYPAIAKEIQKTETLKFKEELKMHKKRLVAYGKESILTQLQSEQAKESLNFVKKYGNDSLAVNDRIYKSTSALVKIEADRRNKMISMAPGLETVIKKETKLTEEQIKAKEGLIKTTKSFKNIKIVDEFHDWSKEIKEANDNLKEAEKIDASFNENVKIGIGIMDDASKSTKTYAEYLDELKQAEIDAEKASLDLLDSIMSVSNTAINGLADLGIISGDTAEKVGNLANAGGNLASGIIKGDPVAIFNGAVDSIVAIMDIFASKGIDKAIDRENAWMDINDEMKESLKELAEEVGNTHAATSIMLDELMEGEITYKNADQWLNRIHGILSDVDRGMLSVSDASKEMGDAFESFIDQVGGIGTGTKEYFEFIDDLKSRGIEVAEVNDYIIDALKSGFEGYKQYLEGDFSDATIGVFEDMLEYEKLVADNQTLVNGIKGLENSLYGMSDAMRLNQEQFDSFEVAAADGYDALIKQGFTAEQSLGMMAPTLYKLKQLQENFGFETDDATQAIIDEADSLGLLKPGPIERMADAMETFIGLLSKQLGLVTENANDNIIDMKDNIIDLGNKWNGLDFKEVSGSFGNNMKGFADGTNGYERIPDGPFTVGERGPEIMDISGSRMNVTPNSQMTTNNASTTNNNYITVDASQFSLQELAEMMNNVSDGNISDFNGTVNKKQKEIA